jgi:hypothetical protein
VFFIVVLVVWTLMHAYVFWRAASVPLIADHVHRGVLIAVAIFLWSSFLLGRMLEHYGVPVIARGLEFFGANWMGVLFLCLVLLFVADVVTGFGFLMPQGAPVVRGWALLLAIVLSVFAVIQGVRPPAVESYEIRVKGLPADRDGTVVVVASDMHVGEVQGKGWLAERVKQIEAEKPDLIVLDGVEAFIDGGPHRGTRKKAAVVLAGTDRIAIDAVGVAILRLLGTTPEVSRGRIFEQDQIARAVELGLGVSSADQIQIVAEDAGSKALAAKVEEILSKG